MFSGEGLRLERLENRSSLGANVPLTCLNVDRRNDRRDSGFSL